MNTLNQHIEALIFCSEQSISIDEIAASLKITFDWDLSEEEILDAIARIKTKYESDDFAFGLEEIAEGFQFLTKKDYHATVSALIQHKAKKKLSTSAMETLAIIAYKQPVTKGEVEHIRGVNCDYAIQKLLEKELIEIKGKSDAPGKPIVYVTSTLFMDYFGIKSVKDLPELKDLHIEQNEIGLPVEYAEPETTEASVGAAAGEPEVREQETIEAIEESDIESETHITDEIISIEEGVDPADLPDRKTIFMEHLEKNASSEDELSSENDDDNSYGAHRD